MNFTLAIIVLAPAILIAAIVLVASPPPRWSERKDAFGFANRSPTPLPDLPALQRFEARDGDSLVYRLYDSEADRILIFLHGSSYHGGGYHELASHVSQAGAAKVVLPNLRGHFLSGRRRGDIEHPGQLEEDILDLIALLRAGGHQGPIVLGGHSSGGGLALRFAGSRWPVAIDRYLLLAPAIPQTPALRGGNAGGWSNVHLRRIIGLLFLNLLRIRGFNALPVIEFNKPAVSWDGSETLAYSFQLNQSYHPRRAVAGDIRGLGGRALTLVGDADEAIDAAALANLFVRAGQGGAVEILAGISHFGVFSDAVVLERIVGWLNDA